MKKRTGFLILLCFLLLLCACTNESEDKPADEDDDPDDVIIDSRIQIGFSLSQEGAFYEQFKIDVENICGRLNYKPIIMTAKDVQQQLRDIKSMLSSGARVIVIDPVNGDKLEEVVAECESSDVPVVGILRDINTNYSTLISIEYKAVGEAIANHASELFSQNDEGGRCAILRQDFSSCASQLLTDGFINMLNANEKLSLFSEIPCETEEQAYNECKKIISVEGVNYIYAHNSNLARGAMRAIKESQKKAYLAFFGADMDLIKSVESKDIEMAVFIGSEELAEYSMGVANEFINSATYEPISYIPLTINIATSESAAKYVSESLSAQVVEDQE